MEAGGSGTRATHAADFYEARRAGGKHRKDAVPEVW
jgi:hypothetical protein